MDAHWLIVDADRAEPKVLRAERARTILDMVSIRVRLAEAEDRAIPLGGWSTRRCERHQHRRSGHKSFGATLKLCSEAGRSVDENGDSSASRDEGQDSLIHKMKVAAQAIADRKL